MTSFHELGLSKQIVATLSQQGYEKPTPIQENAIPLVLEGRDLIGLAQTGTGKTAAFGLPMIEKLTADDKRPDPRNIRALVLAPTRELVNQIAANLRIFVKNTPIKVGVVVGGVSINRQHDQLSRGVDILVATPGRLLDLISRKSVTLTQGRYLVLDEADQMLDLGFIHDLRKISKLVPKNRQTLLFSATMPKTIADLAADYLTDPVKVEVTPPGKAADKVEQYVHFVGGKNDKTEILKQQLNANPKGRAIVFLRTKHGAEKLSKHLDHVGYAAASIHGNKSQGQRERALKGFKDGDISVLVATDVAARGIDIPDVTHVYNYDLPEVPDAYVHRIGRTARAGRDGIAIAFCSPDEHRLLRDIERLMGIEIATGGGERPADLGRGPAGNARSGNRGRGGNGNGQGRPEGRGQRPPRQRFGNGEGRAAEGEGRGERRERPEQRENNRNADFRGQRANERAPGAEKGDGGRPARKPHRKGQGGAAHAHESGAARDNHQGRPNRNGAVRHNSGSRNGQRREQA
ncbi:DEAD/DEAH box helicase [Rhizobiaceae bacterium n13]|uniref:DEAD-box ATP-dependent RNA helicase RhpA n=1 Tax=Ferirhizobium litorale TaxID=2927786 RepID=A0AAE3Q7Z0_9HYPH|nr:DEAD/DEAH box helicase [Fererhizobium litorale]MDI7860769.1 DEAD/DEAH box helicase [Fererhizobium litorale]MDI7920917.1 DEAD/DEAH box helicase [Fererhizobium litorale]